MQDVIIIGGGVIGLTTAYELAGRGVRVTLLDQSQPGREASWAGAGILPPAHPGAADDPINQLCLATHRLWPTLSDDLREQTGIDNGFRQCGGLCFSPDGDEASLSGEIDEWQRAGADVERLTPAQLASLEPSVGQKAGPGYRLADTWQVRNPRHLKALLAACVARGVNVRSGQMVRQITPQGASRVIVTTETDDFESAACLVAAGAWTTRLLEPLGVRRRIEPVRGQMLLLTTPAPVLSHVLECGPRYIVPRLDGRTLVGSTEEWVGFEKMNTPAGLQGLTQFALRMVPALAKACVEQSWAGLRPHPLDGRPLMGRLPDAQNVFVAAGHFRAGLHLSPITSRLMTQLITGETPEISLVPFAPAAHDD